MYNNNLEFQQVLEKMEPKINRVLLSIPCNLRDDVKQEIIIKIYLSLKNIDYFKTPGFFEFAKLYEDRGSND